MFVVGDGRPLILVADDHDFMRGMLGQFLQRQGFHTVEAENGQQAVFLFQQHRPELVLMDALMPVMDGFDACRCIRQSEGGQDVPVIMVTALEDDASVDRAFQSGAEEYITKPIHWSVLKQRAWMLIDTRRLEQERARILRELERSEQHFRSITQSVQDALFTTTEDGNIAFWNQAAERIFGYTASEANGQSIVALLHPESLQTIAGSAYTDNWLQFLDGKSIELTGQRRDGHRFPMDLSV
ncbi:MAG: response regulator, partial [Magnetococcales bacterium]|nr:response regulator [Magnetococcales bacterium]